jgi:hypothetical protein
MNHKLEPVSEGDEFGDLLMGEGTYVRMQMF